MGDLACDMKDVFSAAILSIAGCGPWAVIVHFDSWAMEFILGMRNEVQGTGL